MCYLGNVKHIVKIVDKAFVVAKSSIRHIVVIYSASAWGYSMVQSIATAKIISLQISIYRKANTIKRRINIFIV